MTATRPQPGRNASPRTARAINDRLALRLLQQEGPLTAAQLKELTGLSRPSVADLVERLQDAGLVQVVGEAGAARRGPNARVYGIVADRAYVAGLDVRIDSIGVEIADLLGRTLTRADLAVAEGADPGATVERGVGLLLDAAGGRPLHTVACGAPGLVNPVTGRLATTCELPSWHGDFADEVRGRLGVPVLLENEVNLAAVAEQRARGVADETFVLLWLGGGVGAALVLDGRLRRGMSGGAGEVGFLPIASGDRLPTATNCDDGFHGLAGSKAVCALARAHGVPVDGADALAAAKAVRTGVPGFLDALAARVAVGVAAISPLRTRILPTAVPSGPILRGAVTTAMEAAQEVLFTSGG
jgi:predicted NBD/HSP70 family sugar kinase